MDERSPSSGFEADAGDVWEAGVVGFLTARVHDKVRDLIAAGVDRLVGGLEKAVKGFLGGSGSPAGGSLPANPGPAVPPAPVSAACYTAPGSLSEGTGTGGGGPAGKLFQQFAVLTPFSVVAPLTREVSWLDREPLRPESAPRPPNERPG